MLICRKNLFDFLKSKNIEYVYHANTVQTACTYIYNQALFSRGEVERQGLKQTYQKSDQIDKIFGIWNDIFLDLVDLHGYFPRQNYYGPVLFKFNVDILLDSPCDIQITKSNPTDWIIGQQQADLYYKDLCEYQNEFDYNCRNHLIYKKMTTIKNILAPLPFNNNLVSIILDDPKLHNFDYYSLAYNSLSNLLNQVGYNSDIIVKRECRCNCFCINNYRENSYDLERLFKE